MGDEWKASLSRVQSALFADLFCMLMIIHTHTAFAHIILYIFPSCQLIARAFKFNSISVSRTHTRLLAARAYQSEWLSAIAKSHRQHQRCERHERSLSAFGVFFLLSSSHLSHLLLCVRDAIKAVNYLARVYLRVVISLTNFYLCNCRCVLE